MDTHRVALVGMALLLLAAPAGCSGRSGDGPGDGDPQGGETGLGGAGGSSSGIDTAEEYALDLGWIAVADMEAIIVNFMEDDPTGCAMPDAAGASDGDDSDGSTVNFYIYHEGSPEGEYDLESDVLYGRDQEGTQTGAEWSSCDVETAGTRWISHSGTIGFDLSDDYTQGTFTFTDLLFVATDTGATVVGNGTYTAPIWVGCGILDDGSGDDPDVDGSCGWVADTIPYSTSYCQTMTANYPDDIKR